MRDGARQARAGALAEALSLLIGDPREHVQEQVTGGASKVEPGFLETDDMDVCGLEPADEGADFPLATAEAVKSPHDQPIMVATQTADHQLLEVWTGLRSTFDLRDNTANSESTGGAKALERRALDFGVLLIGRDTKV